MKKAKNIYLVAEGQYYTKEPYFATAFELKKDAIVFARTKDLPKGCNVMKYNKEQDLFLSSPNDVGIWRQIKTVKFFKKEP